MHILCTYSAQIGQGFAPSFVHYSSKSKQATQKEHKQTKGEEGHANKKISCGCRGESHGRILLLCCCLSAASLLMLLRLIDEDHDEDQDEDQGEDQDKGGRVIYLYLIRVLPRFTRIVRLLNTHGFG